MMQIHHNELMQYPNKYVQASIINIYSMCITGFKTEFETQFL